MLTTTTLTAAIVEIPSRIYAYIDGYVNYFKHYKHAVDSFYLFPIESHNTHTIEVEISNGRFFEVTHTPPKRHHRRTQGHRMGLQHPRMGLHQRTTRR